MITKTELIEMIKDTEKKIISLEKSGYSPLSKKYLHYTNKWFELKNILLEVKQ